MDKMFSLEGKIALVTGAAYGICFAMAEALYNAGAKIAFNCRSQHHMDQDLADDMKYLILAVVMLPLSVMAGEPDGTLIADGKSSTTYQLITSSGYMYECPDFSRDHASEPFQHIQQVMDETLKKYVFQFFIHAQIDDDRGIESTTDRQRNEIKTFDNSPEAMIGFEGETMVFKWKFLLPKGLLTTKNFTHIHQLKGIDNKAGTADVSTPLITFTCRTTGSGKKEKQVLQVRHHDRHTGALKTMASADLTLLMGHWVEVTESVRFGEKGLYSVVINDVKTGEQVLRVDAESCDMWRTDCAGLRPKWGIYRYIGDNRSMEDLLRDEELRYADFSIQKIMQPSHICQTIVKRVSEHKTYDALGRRTAQVNRQGLIIIKGGKYFSKK